MEKGKKLEKYMDLSWDQSNIVNMEVRIMFIIVESLETMAKTMEFILDKVGTVGRGCWDL